MSFCACLRPTSGASDGDDSKFYRLSLRFKDVRAEEGFLTKRAARLRTNLFKCELIAVAFAVLALLRIVDRWPTSGGVFIAQASGSAVHLRNWLAVSSVCFHSFSATALKSNAFSNALGPRGLELWALLVILVTTLTAISTNPWYLAAMLGADASSVTTYPSAFNDPHICLFLDVIMSGTHAALPIRWVVLWTTEVGLFLAYPLLALCVGSTLPKDFVFMLTILFATLASMAALGKRSAERNERLAFAQVAEEKTLRFEVEHRLERTEEERRRMSAPADKERPIQQDEACSLPTTGYTGELFSGLKNLSDEEIDDRVQQITNLGYQEHWLVPAADLKAQPSCNLGSGGFGMVFAAKYHGATVAVKIPFAADNVSRTRSFASIAQELRMMRRIRHPNIVLFFGACLVPDIQDIALIMEYVRGVELTKFVNPPPEKPTALERAKLALCVSCALRYMHAQQPRLCHGDIKGANVLVEMSSEGVNAKLIDFGVGRVITKRSAAMGGTPNWMAPEVLLAAASSPTTCADVFSFGRLIFLIMTGQSPLAGCNHRELVMAAEAGRLQELDWPESAPQVAVARRITEACSHIDPASRPSMVQVHEQLRALGTEDDMEEVKDIRELILQARAVGKQTESVSGLAPTPIDWGKMAEIESRVGGSGSSKAAGSSKSKHSAFSAAAPAVAGGGTGAGAGGAEARAVLAL